MSSDVVPQVPVNKAEYDKFCYLIKVMDSVDRAHLLGRKQLDELRLSDGSQGYVDFDWRNVVQHVSPQLQVVFLQDRERDPYVQLFMRFPAYVIVARTAWVVDLGEGFELNLEGDVAHQDEKSATNALRILKAFVQSQEGVRLVDGERALNQLKRVLKLEL